MTETVLDISELIDMESEPGCEHIDHATAHNGGPAAYVIRFKTECGHRNRTLLLCADGYNCFLIECRVCLKIYYRDQCYQIIEVL